MKKLIAFILAAFAVFFSTAHAEFLVMRTHNASITLTQNACPPEVADNLKPEFVDKFKEAWVIFGGQAMVACWIPNPENSETVILLSEAGQAFEVELKQFKVDTGV